MKSSLDEAHEAARSVGICPEQVVERFSRARGPGGQNVNKVSSAVSLHYKPLNLFVRVMKERSQATNRLLAWRRLVEKASDLSAEQVIKKRAERELERRRKRPKPPGLKEKILKEKKRRSEIKRNRHKVKWSG